MNRDGFKCKACGRDDMQLHVHHRYYIRGRSMWEYANDMLVTLCDVCHKKTHDILDAEIKCNDCGVPIEDYRGYGQTDDVFWCESCTMAMENKRVPEECGEDLPL